jgi:hypothetical protein
MTSRPRSIPFFGKLVAEGVMVVVSILIAFSLEAWWDGRGEEQAYAEAMASVRFELESNRARLLQEAASVDRITGAGQSLLDAMRERADLPRIEVADTLAFLITSWTPSMEVSLGASDALIASGKLAQVRNPELRLGLAGIRDRFSDIVEDQLVARMIHVEQQAPVLRTLMDMQPFAPLSAGFFVGGNPATRPIPHLGSVEFPNTLELRNIIGAKLDWYGSARSEMTALIEHLDRLSELSMQ